MTAKKIEKFLKTNPDPCAAKETGAIGFIKYKVEPVFEYTMYILGIMTIMLGALDALKIGLADENKKKKRTGDEVISDMRIRLSETITLGLTFILGAEVVKTFRVPNIYQLIKVTLLVLLRQLITYFLDQDVRRLRKEFPELSK
jgi:uncharacterized membrane protein